MNYEKWLLRIVWYFQSYVFNNLNIINFKHKKSKYFQFFQKITQKLKIDKIIPIIKSIIQKIKIESTINNKYRNHVLKIEKIKNN